MADRARTWEFPSSRGLALTTSVFTSVCNWLAGPFVSGAFTPVAGSGRGYDGMTVTLTEPTVQTDGTYRAHIGAVEPGGNEYIAEADRHGKPSQLFWTWTSPNLEFATIFVGVLSVAVFGMTFWQAALGIIIGSGLGAIAHYFLSARGPLHGVPQMVLGRLPFGFKGNAVHQYLRRGQNVAGFLYDRSYANWNG